MARDAFEYDVGGELRDRYGRPEYVLTPKHATPLSADTSRAYQPTDADGRVQIALLDSAGNDLALNVMRASAFFLPSGDTTGVTDTAKILAAAASGVHILLGPGAFYVTSLLFQNLNGLLMEGSGKGVTILNGVGSGIALNLFGNAGTGSIKYTFERNRYIKTTGNGTSLQVWNDFGFRFESCIFQSEFLAGSIQGSFVGTFDDCEFYIVGANAAPVAALWIGSGKSAPHTGGTTLSGAGALTFDGGLIESFNKAPAIIIEENTFPSRFQSTQLLAKGGTVPMVQVDGLATQVTFDDCYSEQSNNGSVDFSIGVAEGSCGYFACKNYNSTGSSGQNYAFDIGAVRRLLIEKPNCINYALGVVRLRTGVIPIGGNDNQIEIRLADTGANTGNPIYVDDDAHVPSTYRGSLIRAKGWKTLVSRQARLDAAVVTGAGTYPIGQSNPTAAGASDPNEGVAYFYIDPADYGYAPLRVRMAVLTNATAPGQNIVGGLVPASGVPAGGAAAVTQGNGGFVTGSATVTTPALSTQSTATSSVGYITTAGWYALALSEGGAFAANSAVAVFLRLEAFGGV